MKATVTPRGLCGLVLLSLSAGCGTLVFPLQQEQKPDSSVRHRQEVNHSAEALAHYAMGVRENLAGDDEESLRQYELVLQNDPENISLRMELAIAYLHRQQYDKMDALLDEVLVIDSSFVRAYQLRALGYRIRGMYPEATAALSQAMVIEPGEALHYLEMASIVSHQGDLPAAMKILEHGLGKAKDRLSMFQALGELYLKQAADLLAKKKTAKLPSVPLEILKSGGEEFPDDAYLLTQYGELLIQHRKIEDAIDVFARIEALNPTDLAIRQKLALSLLAVGNHERAVSLLEEIVAKRPGNHRLWYYLAELHEQSGNTNKAISAYQSALKANPTLGEAYLKQAFIYLNGAQVDQALEVLNDGAKAMPDDIRMVEMLAYVYLTQANYPRAIEYFLQTEEVTQSQGRKPLLTNFHLNYALARQLNGEEAEAIQILREGAAERPEIIEDFMGISFRDRGNKPRMKSTLMILESFQDVIPEDSGTYTLYALIAFNAEEYQAAQTLFERAESMAMSSDMEEELTAQFYFWVGATAERNKQYDQAEEYFIKAISLQPDHADAHNYLAYMHAEQGIKLDLALDHVGVALAIDPDNAAYIDTRGWIYYHQGKFAEALEDTLAAAEKLNDDPTILDHIGDIYLALDDLDNAITYWKSALRFDPGNETIKAKLIAHGAEITVENSESGLEPESKTEPVESEATHP